MTGPGLPTTSRRSVLRSSALGVGAALAGAGTVVTAAAQPAAAASSGRIFLTLDGIFGDSTAEGHPQALEVDEVKWGATQATGGATGSGSRSNRSNAEPVTITARTGSHTPGLLARCVSGRPITNGQVDLIGPAMDSTSELQVVRIRLTDILVSALHTQFSSAGDLVDEFALTFQKIAYSYFPQKPDGSAGDPLLTTWEVAGNRVTSNALRTS